jgi:deaminated glutathione amidase
MNSGPVIADNLAQAQELIQEAARQGSQLILTPENTCHILQKSSDKLKTALPEDEHPAVPFFSNLAQQLKITLVIGSMSIKIADDKIFNRCFVFGADGSILARYDKIHLFDVVLPTGETHRESETMQAGRALQMVDLGDFKLGCSICYDVRFPHLYRTLAQQGANVMLVPSAFTVPTGLAHWHVLLRARAIESQSYVLAAAQCGTHDGGRKTYGHSLIVEPWGGILAEAKEDVPCVVTAQLDLEKIKSMRQSIPSLKNQAF